MTSNNDNDYNSIRVNSKCGNVSELKIQKKLCDTDVPEASQKARSWEDPERLVSQAEAII